MAPPKIIHYALLTVGCILLACASSIYTIDRLQTNDPVPTNRLREGLTRLYYRTNTTIVSPPDHSGLLDVAASPTRRRNATLSRSSFESKWSWSNTDWDDWIEKCCGNFINTHTGCKVARYYYLPDEVKSPLPSISHRDCDGMPVHRKLLNPKRQLKENDTIYVNIIALEQFIDEVLDEISVNVVIICGQDHLVPETDFQRIEKLLKHERVLRFFRQNIPKQWEYINETLRNEKLSPFPYGFKGYESTASPKFSDPNLRETLERSRTKEGGNLIYAGPLSKSNAVRKNIPQETERLHVSEFYARMANATYVLSPDGDRPDCHRHYEAILFGAVPITQLDRALYSHMAGAPVVYDNNNWNLTLLSEELDPNPEVNRNVCLEEYWIDWVDMTVGLELNWSDDIMKSHLGGFPSGARHSWTPIIDEQNDWVGTSDRGGFLCLRHSFMNPPGGPSWGLSNEEGSEIITRHIACCLMKETSSVTTNTNSIGNGIEGLKPLWFDRKSGWNGSTYNEGERFCSGIGRGLCQYDILCPNGASDSQLNR